MEYAQIQPVGQGSMCAQIAVPLATATTDIIYIHSNLFHVSLQETQLSHNVLSLLGAVEVYYNESRWRLKCL